MTAQQARSAPIASVGEAQHAIANLERIMESLLTTVEEETALVRGGRIKEAAQLGTTKSELAGYYLAETERLKASKGFMQQSLPEALASLRRRHESFHALLQINLTVLATAHAVSEGIVRSVSDEINRAQVPQTYGATGRATVARPKNRQPIAISRTL
ncbi:MAG TPA: hypothetical protein VHD59_12790 [Pseudolabrys sp.]|nr:hypothetical protein [Pseudolabrys sp.]